MVETFLPTSALEVKITPPPVRSRRLVRDRLLTAISEALTVPLTLVCAPAGYGKTSLLADWARRTTAGVAWLTLEEEENDAARFLNFAVLALQRIYPDFGKSARAALEYPSRENERAVLYLLAGDLAALPEPSVLVIDDTHRVDNPEVYAALEFLIERLPPHVHLVLAGRVEPPLSLPRLRARGALLELRAAELGFLPEESIAFFREVMRLDLPPEVVARLTVDCEGWAAALQIAGLSLRGKEPLSVRPGSRHIFDFFADEVLARQPLPVQSFLLRTSPLDRLTGPLCDALAESFLPGQDGAACLEALERANLFTIPLDGERRWYRYHALFADFLRERLRRSDPAAVPALHAAAARRLAQFGLYDDALRHAFLSGDHELAADLLAAHAEDLERAGELQALASWLGALPQDIIHRRPVLSTAAAWIAISRLEFTLADAWLDSADRFFEQAPAQAVPAVIGPFYAARALNAGMQGRSEDARRYSGLALAHLPDENHYLYSLARLNLSFGPMFAGDVVQAARELESSVRAALRARVSFIALLSLRILGEAYLQLGRIQQAELTFRRIEEIVVREIGTHSPLKGLAWMGLGEAARQRNRLDEARDLLYRGVETTLPWMPAVALDGLLWVALLEQEENNFLAAFEALQRAAHLGLEQSQLHLQEWWLDLSIARLNLRQGRLDEVGRWAARTALDLEGFANLAEYLAGGPLYLRLSALILLAGYYYILGRQESVAGALPKALQLLEFSLPYAEMRSLNALIIEALVRRSLVQSALGDPEGAQESLHRALDLAAPEEALRVFLDEGADLVPLLEQRAALPLPFRERAFLSDILAAIGPIQSKTPVPLTAAVLTRREMEVLRCLAAGKTNQEIAEELVLALDTVKKHVGSVLAKLEVKNRTQAARAAREREIL